MLQFTRPELLSSGQAAQLHDRAKHILQEIGINVCHAGALDHLRREGYSIRGTRVLFEPAVIEKYVEEMRRWISSRPPQPGEPGLGRLTLTVSPYSQNLHDVESGRVVPYTIERLIEMCKLVDSLAKEGVDGTPPGMPPEVHPDLQPVAQYRIGALYARQGARPVDPTSSRTVNHLLDMAEVMRRPIRTLPVYVVTPLSLGGESLDVVMACVDRLDEISISSMPATGATAPIHAFGALALAAAELMGGMVILRVLTGKPVTFSTGIFPFDMRAGAMVFGSPENMLFHMVCADFDRFYSWPWHPAPYNVHVMAKLPDAQAAAEKAAIMSLGAFLGARHFMCAGTLSLDEVFSPEQLLVDCEIRDWVQRAIQGVWLGEEVVDDWLAEIKAGVTSGFMSLDTTLDHYKRDTWYPRRFQRNPLAPWLSAGQPPLSTYLKAEVRRRIAAHNFELDSAQRLEIDKIYLSAEKAVNRQS